MQVQEVAMQCSSTHGSSSGQWGLPWWSPNGFSGTQTSLWLPWPTPTAWSCTERGLPSKPWPPSPYRCNLSWLCFATYHVQDTGFVMGLPCAEACSHWTEHIFAAICMGLTSSYAPVFIGCMSLQGILGIRSMMRCKHELGPNMYGHLSTGHSAVCPAC